MTFVLNFIFKHNYLGNFYKKGVIILINGYVSDLKWNQNIAYNCVLSFLFRIFEISSMTFELYMNRKLKIESKCHNLIKYDAECG